MENFSTIRLRWRRTGRSLPAISKWLFAALVVLVAAGCGQIDTDGAAPVDMGHVHDLVSGLDGSVLAATHAGLYRVEGPDRADLVGTEHHELMALARLTENHLIASGHPDVRLGRYRIDGLPPYLGLIESRDEGQTWLIVGKLGEVEFHALASTSDGVFGVDANDGAIWLLAEDGRWEKRGSISASDLAVDPADPQRQVAVGPIGRLWASDDGGRSWSELSNTPTLVELEWPASDQLYGIDANGVIWAARSPEADWEEAAQGPAQPEAFAIDEFETWWAASDGGRIARSNNHGADWVEVHSPPPPL